MADYKSMYHILCSAASKALDTPLKNASEILQKALREAEEIYLCTCGEDETEKP